MITCNCRHNHFSSLALAKHKPFTSHSLTKSIRPCCGVCDQTPIDNIHHHHNNTTDYLANPSPRLCQHHTLSESVPSFAFRLPQYVALYKPTILLPKDGRQQQILLVQLHEYNYSSGRMDSSLGESGRRDGYVLSAIPRNMHGVDMVCRTWKQSRVNSQSPLAEWQEESTNIFKGCYLEHGKHCGSQSPNLSVS